MYIYLKVTTKSVSEPQFKDKEEILPIYHLIENAMLQLNEYFQTVTNTNMWHFTKDGWVYSYKHLS